MSPHFQSSCGESSIDYLFYIFYTVYILQNSCLYFIDTKLDHKNIHSIYRPCICGNNCVPNTATKYLDIVMITVERIQTTEVCRLKGKRTLMVTTARHNVQFLI